MVLMTRESEAAAWGLREVAGEVEWSVRASPRASRNAILGQQDGATRIALTAPPVDGAANAALTEFIADTLGVSKRQVTLVRGDTARNKLFRIEGITLVEAWGKLQGFVEESNR